MTKSMKACMGVVFTALLWTSASAIDRDTINLNGRWLFEQTVTAVPPAKFSRTIPVPGLIHLATPRIEQYDVLFRKPGKVEFGTSHNVQNQVYKPRYNWYYRKVFIGEDVRDKHAVLTIMKSMFVTRVFVNGMDVGSSMECYTPIQFPVTQYLKFGQENEILVQVGDRAWLPSQAAGGTDKEKVNYLPGIWDNVYLSFSGNFAVHKALMLPSLKDSKVVAKLQIRSFYPPQLLFGARMYDSATVEVAICEKASGKVVARERRKASIKRDNITTLSVDVLIDSPHLWTPDDPFLYTADIRIFEKDSVSDSWSNQFGMREFGRKGKFFTLNGEKIILRGTNITLHRFFEDPECSALPWNREWVRKLLGEIPKQKHWNTMRICVGLVPDFWYDIADEYGLMLQNEWFYWQNHGWDEEIRKEYTNWVWSDGNHPSIVIWDAINENWDNYIGMELIPELKKLDPTRLWDSGFMTADDLGAFDDMDEPHPYVDIALNRNYKEFRDKNPYPLGDLDYPGGDWKERFISSSVPQLVNEYGWMWLWRDGQASKLTVKNYDYYLGDDIRSLSEKRAADRRRELQAYWLQLQTEWLRSNRSLAGVLQFCYLTNNYGFTGDAFIGPIKDLRPSPMLKWFDHCFAPVAAFINLTDERYMKHVEPHKPGSTLVFNIYAVNDLLNEAQGKVTLRMLNSRGKEMERKSYDVRIHAYGKTEVPCIITLPEVPDGYLLLAAYSDAQQKDPVISRRYIKVGTRERQYDFYEVQP